MFKKVPLHIQIIIGIILGIAWGVLINSFPDLKTFNHGYIAPIGKIFISLLKLLAIPLVLTSLISGIASMNETKQLTKVGLRAIAFFMVTAVIATAIGLVSAHVIQPGNFIDASIKENIVHGYESQIGSMESQKEFAAQTFMQLISSSVPDNIFSAAGNNKNMLQVVIFAILFGIAITKTISERAKPVISFFESTNEVLTNLVGIIMQLAPIGVFALVGSVLADLGGNSLTGIAEILFSLLFYMLAVLIGLIVMGLIVYPLILKFYTGTSITHFFKAMRPVFLMAFSTSSSAATLPLTISVVEKELKVSPAIARFVLPLGSTINMDGTALYQCVAALFISQVYGIDLSIGQQLIIIFTALMGAVGAAGVPGAGMITLVMVLQSVGIPVEGLALIMAPDRILDMCRTVINVTGDTTTSIVMNEYNTKQ